MDMNNPRFPFRKLPEKALRNVILCMRVVDMIALSLGSRFTKKMVSDQKIEITEYRRNFAKYVVLEFLVNDEELSMSLDDDELFGWAYGDEKIQFRNRRPGHVYVYNSVMNGQMWNKPNYYYRDWVTHMNQLFVYSQAIDSFTFGGAERYDVQSLREEFQEYPNRAVYLSETCPEIILQQVYRDLGTYKIFEVDGVPDVCGQNFEQYSLQNFDDFIMNNDNDLHLDQLTLNGSEIIDLIEFMTFSAKNINRFIRLWIKGSNPRLRFVSVNMVRWKNADVNQVLKGVPHQNLADEKVEVFHKRVWNRNVCSGIRITSKAGKRATLVFEPKADEVKTKMEMYVWN